MPNHMGYLNNAFAKTKKKEKTTIKLYPIFHDHYPRSVNDIPKPNWNFSL